MSIRKTLLAAAAMAAFAFAALPAITSAEITTAPELDPHQNGDFPVPFVMHSGPSLLLGGCCRSTAPRTPTKANTKTAQQAP